MREGIKHALVVSTVLLSAFALTAMSSVQVAAKPTPKWLFCVYANGDTNDYVEYAIIHDIQELADARNTKDVVVLALVDVTHPWKGASDSNARLYEFKMGGKRLIEDWGEVNMGDPRTLSKFVSYCFNYTAAPNRAVILVDHGMSWKGVCRDYTSGDDSLTLAELGTAFANVQTFTGKTASLIGFDACVMGYIEVAYQLRNYCTVMVGAEEVEWTLIDSNPADGYLGGWPFDTIVAALTANPTMTAVNLGSVIVNKYTEFWGPDPANYQYFAISAIRTSFVGWLTNSVNYLGSALQGLLPTYHSELYELREDTETFYFGEKSQRYADLYDFCDRLRNSPDIIIGRGTSIICGDVIEYITDMMIAEWHSSKNPGAHGVGIYFPNGDRVFETDYSQIAFATSGAPSWVPWLLSLQF